MKLKAIFRMRGFIQDCYSYLIRQDRKLNEIQKEIKNHIVTRLDEHGGELKMIDGKLKTINGKLDLLIGDKNANRKTGRGS